MRLTNAPPTYGILCAIAVIALIVFRSGIGEPENNKSATGLFVHQEQSILEISPGSGNRFATFTHSEAGRIDRDKMRLVRCSDVMFESGAVAEILDRTRARTVVLVRCSLSTDDMKELSSVTSLLLVDCAIPDEAVDELCKLEGLLRLEIAAPTSSEIVKRIDEVRAALPRCNVVY